jgi:NADPH:quinone reductase-like Zn-dependent oxidoreductase
MMKAIVYQEYGSTDVLQLKDIDKPTIGDTDMLVRVGAASLNPYDWHLLTGLPYFARLQFGLRQPKANGLGADLAGQVEAIGSGVTQFRPGDEVFGEVVTGAFAEYVRVPQKSAAPKPSNLSHEEAAAVPMGGLTALQALRDTGRIQPGQQVLINGSSGGVGTFAVQIAKSFGAEVTGVCSTRNVDLVRSLGADHVIDYTSEDFTKGEQRYDLMLDNVGNHSVSRCRGVLSRTGVYVATFGQPEHRWLGPLAQMLRILLLSPLVSQKLIPFNAKTVPEDLDTLRELIEAGKVAPVIDRTYPLSQVPEAMAYLEEGRTRGKVAISV